MNGCCESSHGCSASTVSAPTLLLRHEVKPGERRTPLPPSAVNELLAAGFRVQVERSATRCFSDHEYEQAGIQLVPTGAWRSAPADVVIVGLKELPEDVAELKHTHIFFAHCFKNQAGWQDVLRRFQRGKGTLLDLEYLVDDQGRRVAAFGRPAGSVGAAVGVLQWIRQQQNGTLLAPLEPWETEERMVEQVRAELTHLGRTPRVIVLGALGRCGQGSVDVLRRVGIPAANLALWDLAETKRGGPFPETLEYDILINDIYLGGAIPPFLTPDLLQQPRRLTVLVDVSCDTSNPHNPVPVYKEGTTLDRPVEHVCSTAPRFDVVAIDHLPTLLPRESSVGFARDLLPHLLKLNKTPVWSRARAVFEQKSALLPPQKIAGGCSDCDSRQCSAPLSNGLSNGHANGHVLANGNH